MAKEQVKHHFIPQCYLRNFSENGKFLNVYSKKNPKKGYSQSIAKTACIDYFYTILERYISQDFATDIGGNYIEKKVLAEHIERLYSELLRKIVLAGTSWLNQTFGEILGKKERDIFAALIAIQYLRMPNFKDMHWSAQKKNQKERNEIVDAIKRVYGDIDCSEATELNREDDYASVFHSEIFLDEELIAGIQDQIIKKIWIFKIVPEDLVYSSDNPILLKPHIRDQFAYYSGFGMKGVEIIFPISKNIILTIWDEEIFASRKVQNDNFINLTGPELRQYNCYQYMWSNDEVYSSRNDFEMIELLKMASGNTTKEITFERPIIKINGK